MIWRNAINFYDQATVEEAKKNPVIIHFTRNFYMLSRPWIKKCDHPFTDRYLEFKKLTPWTELEEDNRTNWQKIKYKLWHLFPQKFLVVMANIAYNNIRPKLYWRNE